MRKIFYILFLVFFSFLKAFASDDIKIITREEWWANENYRYIDSNEWKNILEKMNQEAENAKNITYTQEQINASKAKQEKLREMDQILLDDFWDEIELDTTIYNENWEKLAWPIAKTKQVKWIVIHHTYSDYEDSYDGIRQIYKYHALTNRRWDIWYNYLIWKNWEIFEWRAWWDYAVWAHDKWNNRATVWIALIWDYTQNPINDEQYESLKNLTKYLIEKYNIDLSKQTYFHEECFWDTCEKALFSELMDPIIWHRDAWHTDCPWDELYEQINQLKNELKKDPISVATSYKLAIYSKLEQFSDEKLIDILAKFESDLDNQLSSSKLKLRWILIDYFEYKKTQKNISSVYENKEIKIKLSYPDKDKISIKSWTAVFDITRKWNYIYVKWQKYNILKIPKKYQNTILEIVSWDRVPAWDTEGKYNDNKFRGDLYVYAKDNELVVVNSLKIEDYLKWLGEVSDFENIEKIKTIIIAARTYATWYVTKDKKFEWEFYDWSDDPNVFQKYLWYWLESRSPNINKIVKETEWQIITYNWDIIKPWYFSSSNWKTMSFYEYCSIRYSDWICSKEASKYPYLQSVLDKWSEWKTKAWHGVWISWAWVSYFADKWWTYDMIIKYFLKWVEIL